MRLSAPVHHTERLQRCSERLDQATQRLAKQLAFWEIQLAKHRVPVALLGGGVLGVAAALRWQALARIASKIATSAVRAAMLALVLRVQVTRATQTK
jgi:hypothetical protein